MRISGFTIARQAVTFGYPLEESLRSLLPLVDELVVNVGDGDDGTWELVQGIADPKIAAFRSTWDTAQRDGLTLSEETNKALARCHGDWAMYLQADEVLHEQELPALRAALERYHRSRTESLSFHYYHFYGSYRTIQDDPRHWYRRATRAVRIGAGVESVGDACAFMVREGNHWRRPRRKDLAVHVYHYGWARPPQLMARKQYNFQFLYHDATWVAAHGLRADATPSEIFAGCRHLRRFAGTHPAVMQQRIAAQPASFEPDLRRPLPEWVRRAYVYGAWILGRLVA